MRSFKRMLLGAMTALVLVSVLAVGTASAVTPPVAPTGLVPSENLFTQDANAPYLAWQGEHVRLVACDAGTSLTGDSVSWMLVDPLNWPDFQPQVDVVTAKIVGGCAVGVWVSDKPGLAALKVIVHDPAGKNVFEKQFLVGWMTLNKPAVTGGGDVNAGDFCNRLTIDTLTQESIKLLGPYSNCWHDPIDPRHRINVLVTGNLPLEADFSNWGLGDHLTLPNDWAKW
ncbi:MAG: hypothetical protein QOC98_1628, partial [Frankiaceae bacterium]|nr:hypothetical protein [Frankiaceae bacterium]